VKEVGYVPLPVKAYELATDKLRARVTGTVFTGGAEVGIGIEELLKRQPD
jgi:phosphate transport system substrate-binding protein